MFLALGFLHWFRCYFKFLFLFKLCWYCVHSASFIIIIQNLFLEFVPWNFQFEFVQTICIYYFWCSLLRRSAAKKNFNKTKILCKFIYRKRKCDSESKVSIPEEEEREKQNLLIEYLITVFQNTKWERKVFLFQFNSISIVLNQIKRP